MFSIPVDKTRIWYLTLIIQNALFNYKPSSYFLKVVFNNQEQSFSQQSRFEVFVKEM